MIQSSWRRGQTLIRPLGLLCRKISSNFDLHDLHGHDLAQEFCATMKIIENYVDEESEKKLMEEIEPRLKRYRYGNNHLDHVIKSYKEIEISDWGSTCSPIIQMMRKGAFSEEHQILVPVHVLDLSPDGYIDPHIDSIKFCGPIITGLSLLSDAVMQFTHCDKPELIIDVLLKRRSLYIMKGAARYDFKHAILGDERSTFRGEKVPRQRRVSIICRCDP
ncbi:alpha-ketoglutarate-dependent dioxygenase alkB homolog 7, mitochondrial [Brevipalpus obovatus]|uniref:alpha-ketoglutarate-dependent dioxygenase alkB homolog 7, mitochondrial n=1 Tax=Brevipalpus obovatus TaxID=246614 RepID=UPI003D9E5BC4